MQSKGVGAAGSNEDGVRRGRRREDEEETKRKTNQQEARKHTEKTRKD